MATGNESCGVNSNLVNKITEGNQYHDVDPVEYYQNWMTMIGNQGNPGLIMSTARTWAITSIGTTTA